MVAAAPSSTRGRVRFLHGLRGLAAISVVVLHLLAAPLGDISSVVGAVAKRGFLGACIFFVISGKPSIDFSRWISRPPPTPIASADVSAAI